MAQRAAWEEDAQPSAFAWCGPTSATASSRTASTRSPSFSDAEDVGDVDCSPELVVKNTFLAFPVRYLEADGPSKRRWRSRSAPCRPWEVAEAPSWPVVAPHQLLQAAAALRPAKGTEHPVTPSPVASTQNSPLPEACANWTAGGAAAQTPSGATVQGGEMAALGGASTGTEGCSPEESTYLRCGYPCSLRVKNTFLEFEDLPAEEAVASPQRAASAPPSEKRGRVGPPQCVLEQDPSYPPPRTSAKQAALLPPPALFAALPKTAMPPMPVRPGRCGPGPLKDSPHPLSAASAPVPPIAAGPVPPASVPKAAPAGGGVVSPGGLAGGETRPVPGTTTFPTVGSMGHYLGKCKPCAFMHTSGCTNGSGCAFCHLCGPGVRKKRQVDRPQRPPRLRGGAVRGGQAAGAAE